MLEDYEIGPHHFFSGIEEDVSQALHSQLRKILNETSSSPKAHKEFSDCLTQFKFHVPLIPYLEISPKLIANKKGSHPIAALLAHPWPDNCPQYDRLCSLVVMTAFLLQAKRKDYLPTIQPACRALYRSVHDLKFLKKLPILSLNIESAHKEIKSLVNDRQTFDRAETNKLLAIRRLFQKLANQKDPTNRSKSATHIFTTEVKNSGLRKDAALQINDPLPRSDSFSGERGAEKFADTPKTKAVFQHKKVSAKDPKSRSPDLLQKYSSQVSQKIILNQMNLASNWNSMPLVEAVTLINNCHKRIDDPVQTSNWPYLLILLSAIIGRHAVTLAVASFKSKLIKSPGEYWYNNNGIIHLSYKADIARNKIEDDDLYDIKYKKLAPHLESSPFLLPIPAIYQKALLAFFKIRNKSSKEVIEKTIRDALKTLNQNKYRPYSLGRVSNFLSGFQSRRGIDELLTAWLSGMTPSEATDMQYSSLNSDLLIRIYYEFLDELNKKLKVKITLPKSLTKDDVIGSILVPSDRSIQSLFSTHFGKLQSVGQVNAVSDWIKFQSLYVYYVYELLSLSTGHRSVTKPFGSLLDIDLRSSFLFIQDKDTEKKPTPRLVPLAAKAVEQITEYIKFLKIMRKRIEPYDTNLSGQIDIVLQGRSPFLFLINNEHELLPFDPKNLEFYRENFWPYPLNWPRHYLLSKFLESELPCELKRGFVGHGQFGKNIFSPLSGASLAQIKQISPYVDRILDGLEVEVFTCPNL